MSQPFCVVESACCEWKDYMVGAVFGPMDEDEAHAAAAKLTERIDPHGAVHYAVRPMEGVPAAGVPTQAEQEREAAARNFMRDKPA